MSQSASFNNQNNETMVSNPEPEPVFIGREGKTNFIKSLICIGVDFIVTIFLIFVECGLFKIFEDELKKIKLVIMGIIAFAFFLCIIVFIISHITILVLISKYVYISVGAVYYLYKLVIMIIYLIQNEKGISNSALVFFIIVLATIIPRVFGFYNIEQLVKVCKKVDENKRILDHEKFVEKLGNRIDAGISRWSNATNERWSNVNQENENKKN